MVVPQQSSHGLVECRVSVWYIDWHEGGHCSRENCKHFVLQGLQNTCTPMPFLGSPSFFMPSSDGEFWAVPMERTDPTASSQLWFQKILSYVSLCSFHYWVLLAFLRAYQNSSNPFFILNYQDTWKELSCLPTPKCSLGETSPILSSASYITRFGLVISLPCWLLPSACDWVRLRPFKLKWKETVVK